MVAACGKDAYGGDVDEMWRRRDAISLTSLIGTPHQDGVSLLHLALFLGVC